MHILIDSTYNTVVSFEMVCSTLDEKVVILSLGGEQIKVISNSYLGTESKGNITNTSSVQSNTQGLLSWSLLMITCDISRAFVSDFSDQNMPVVT